MATNELKLEAVRLALASVFGAGHETRDHVELAAAVVGEVFTLRGKLAECAKLGAETDEQHLESLARLEAKFARMNAETDALKAQRDAIARLLSDHGCDCECGCDGDGHVCDETPCFPCQVEAAMKVTVR